MKLRIGFSVIKTIVMENFHHDRFFILKIISFLGNTLAALQPQTL